MLHKLLLLIYDYNECEISVLTSMQLKSKLYLFKMAVFLRVAFDTPQLRRGRIDEDALTIRTHIEGTKSVLRTRLSEKVKLMQN